MERDGRDAPTVRRPLLPSARSVALVAAGGAIGTAARYGVGGRFPVEAGELPLATFGENVLGAALLGLLVAVLASRRPYSGQLRLLLATGTLGAFTTFSSFASEVVVLVRDDHVGLALAYVVATLVAGVAAAAAGVRLGSRLSGPTPRQAVSGHEVIPEKAPNR